MKTEFSFNYGEKRHVFSALDNAIYNLDNEITVEVQTKSYEEYDAVEWVLHFENISNKDSQMITDICDCDTLLPLEFPVTPNLGYMPKPGDACIITMNGMVYGGYYWENDKVSATEYGINYEYLDKAPNKTKCFANIGGRSSEGMMPFFDVTASGNGYIAAVGWTGDWKTEFSKLEQGIQMKSGLKETNFYLKPGERLRTSSVLIMKYASTEDKYNKFRKLIKNHFSHKSNNPDLRDGLMAIELWGGLPSHEMKKRINELKENDIKYEQVWLDAGWYGQSKNYSDVFYGDWSIHTGEWEINSNAHPEALQDVVACAKSAGMKLMLWVEPERAIKGTKITEQHPEWFLSIPEDNQLILNYGNEEAKEYVYNVLSNYVEELELACYRQDFNVPITDYFKDGDEENRRGITEIKHVMGMYEIWDRLHEKYPHLMIDNCSAGGRRIDIETLKRSIPFFRSDYQCNVNENPEVSQTHNSNICKYLPYHGCASKTKGDTYGTRSTYSSSWGSMFYNTISRTMSDEDFKWAKEMTDEYRRLRKYFSMDFYNHGSNTFDNTAWVIWQYHNSETQSGIVMAFRRSESPFEQVTVQLKGLDENKTYTYQNLDSGLSTDASDTLSISLPEARSCTIFEYNLK